MDLGRIKNTLNQVATKQRLSSSKTQEIIDYVCGEIEHSITKLQTDCITSNSDPSNPAFVVAELNNKLNVATPLDQLEGSQKDLNIELNKYIKVLNKSFTPDISKAYHSVDFDIRLINQIIGSYFYHQGMFDIGDCFAEEAEVPDVYDLKSKFLEMHAIIEAMKSRDLEPAISWACKQRTMLSENGSSLHFELHLLEFMERVQKGSIEEALNYGKMYLAPFYSIQEPEISKVMSCLICPAGKLLQSPCAEFISPTRWNNLTQEFTRQFCSLLGQSHRSALRTVVDAGVKGLPALLKSLTIKTANKQEWQSMMQLAVHADIGKEFQFHSFFVCPVLKEQVSDDNPPMMMPCAHVISRESIERLSKDNTSPFMCPFCPLLTWASECRQLHL